MASSPFASILSLGVLMLLGLTPGATAGEELLLDRPSDCAIVGDTPTEFSFTCSRTGIHRFETGGDVDTVLEVYDGERLLAENDDISGEYRCSWVFLPLHSGQRVRVRVRGYDAEDNGIAMVIAERMGAGIDFGVGYPRTIELMPLTPEVFRFVAMDTGIYRMVAVSPSGEVDPSLSWQVIRTDVGLIEEGASGTPVVVGLAKGEGVTIALWSTAQEARPVVVQVEEGGELPPIAVGQTLTLPSLLEDTEQRPLTPEVLLGRPVIFAMGDPAELAGLLVRLHDYICSEAPPEVLVVMIALDGPAGELASQLSRLPLLAERTRLVEAAGHRTRLLRYYRLEGQDLPLIMVLDAGMRIGAIGFPMERLGQVLSRLLG